MLPHHAVLDSICVAHPRWLVLQVHWPFTDQNTEELTPPYQKTWEGMEEVQREVRHLLLVSVGCAYQRLSVPVSASLCPVAFANDRQDQWCPKEVEELCSGVDTCS